MIDSHIFDAKLGQTFCLEVNLGQSSDMQYFPVIQYNCMDLPVHLVHILSLYCPSCLAFCCSLPAFTICEIDKNVITALCITVLQVFIQREMYKDEIVFLLQEYNFYSGMKNTSCDLVVSCII